MHFSIHVELQTAKFKENCLGHCSATIREKTPRGDYERTWPNRDPAFNIATSTYENYVGIA